MDEKTGEKIVKKRGRGRPRKGDNRSEEQYFKSLEEKEKSPRGCPKRVYTEAQKKSITEMAKNGCKLNTIAVALEIPVSSLKLHYGNYIRHKTAVGKTELRANQRKMSIKNPAMAIFLGKNELDQSDKKDINLGKNVSIILERE